MHMSMPTLWFRTLWAQLKRSQQPRFTCASRAAMLMIVKALLARGTSCPPLSVAGNKMHPGPWLHAFYVNVHACVGTQRSVHVNVPPRRRENRTWV